MKSLIKALMINPKVLIHPKNIFLLSHMRANTSLLGHLLGSHPSIEGYYEMHMGYYSWKSKFRQRLLYLEDHPIKPTSEFFFDKLLHNEHCLFDELICSENSKIIIMLREPKQVVASIVHLYQSILPGHEYCHPDKAIDYYVSRLQNIQRLLAENKKMHFFYIEADELRREPQIILSGLSDWLRLTPLLASKYRHFNHTGKLRYGDSSINIQASEVIHQRTEYPPFACNQTALQQAEEEFVRLSAYCKKNSDK